MEQWTCASLAQQTKAEVFVTFYVEAFVSPGDKVLLPSL